MPFENLRDAYNGDVHDGPPALSSSIAHQLINRSPAHAWLLHPRLGGFRREPTQSMIRGTVLHASLLRDPHHNVVVINADDFRSAAARMARDEAIARGHTPITRPQHDELSEIAERVGEHILSLGFNLARGDVEWIGRWQSGDVYCKMRADCLQASATDAVVIDIKSADSASPRDFPGACMRHGYDIQVAAYIAGVEAIQNLHGRVEFVWLVFETEPPYCVTPFVPSGEMLEFGRRKWARAVQLWGHCLARGTDAQHWPGYASAPVRVSPPVWAMRLEEEAE